MKAAAENRQVKGTLTSYLIVALIKDKWEELLRKKLFLPLRASDTAVGWHS